MTNLTLPERSELRALVDAIERHELGSAELPSYLAGLAPSAELMELVADLTRPQLPPHKLAARLKKLLEG